MGVDVSGATRMKFVEVAGSALSSALGWGLGTGGFSDLLSKGDYRFYPHNLFAEVGIENGLPGLLALFGFLGSGMARALRAARDPYVLAAFLGFLYAFLNAQFSGDLMANEWIWLFAGLIAGRTR
jgi:O-antigen ligase